MNIFKIKSATDFLFWRPRWMQRMDEWSSRRLARFVCQYGKVIFDEEDRFACTCTVTKLGPFMLTDQVLPSFDRLRIVQLRGRTVACYVD